MAIERKKRLDFAKSTHCNTFLVNLFAMLSFLRLDHEACSSIEVSMSEGGREREPCALSTPNSAALIFFRVTRPWR